MSKAFESEVLFSELLIELMSKEIGEIRGKLKDKSVIDLEKSLPIILINKGSTDIEFEKINILKLKLFSDEI